MRKRTSLTTFAMTLALASLLALAGCASQSASSSSAASDSSTAASSSSSTAASSSSSSAASTLTWTSASSADAAAQGAGLDGFTVPDAGTEISIGALQPWSFSYAANMAEADGGAGAAAIVVRKALGSGDNTKDPSTYTANWSELSTMAFSNEWTVDIEGTQVNCYGNTKGQATKAIWKDGANSYSILALGQGDNWKDFGLAEDDITTLVKGTQNAAAPQQTQQPTSSPASSQAAAPTPAFNVENAVFNYGLGDFVSYYQNSDGTWSVVTRGVDGNEYTSIFGADGSLISNGYTGPQQGDPNGE